MTNRYTGAQIHDYDSKISLILSKMGTAGGLFCVLVILSLPEFDFGETVSRNYVISVTTKQLFILSWLILTISFFENAYLRPPNVISHLFSGVGIFFAVASYEPVDLSNIWVGSGALLVILLPWILLIFHRVVIQIYIRQKRIEQLDTAKVIEYRPSIILFIIGWIWFWLSNNFGFTS